MIKKIIFLALSLLFLACDLSAENSENSNNNTKKYISNTLLNKIDEIIADKKACDSGDIDACYELGAKYEKGEVVRQNYIKAFHYFSKAKNSKKGLAKIAFYLHLGLGTKQDFYEAFQIYDKLCKTSELGCVNSEFLRKIVVEKAPFDTLAFLAKTCEENNAQNCYILNRYLIKNKELKKAWEYALKACLAGFDYACRVGFLELKSTLKKSDKEVFEIARDLCQKGLSTACYELSNFYDYGIDGSGRDYAQNTKFKERACELGHLFACSSLALLYSNPYYKDKGDFETKLDASIVINTKICEFSKVFKDEYMGHTCDFIKYAKQTKQELLYPKKEQKWQPPLTPLPKDEQITLGDCPQDVCPALVYFRQLAGIGENMICDDENSKMCQEHLNKECANAGTNDDIRHCKDISLSWNSSFSGRHARYATQYMMVYLRDAALANYDKNAFLYFLKYTKNLGASAYDILSTSAGDDVGMDNDAPFIAHLAKNNGIWQIKDIKEVFGTQNEPKLIKLLDENNATKEMKEILLK